MSDRVEEDRQIQEDIWQQRCPELFSEVQRLRKEMGRRDESIAEAMSGRNILDIIAENDRLKKVEEAALEYVEAEAKTQPPTAYAAVEAARAALSSLSNTLEQQVPEPVREEMER